MELKEGAMILHGLRHAVVGVSDGGLLIYDHSKMVRIFEGQGMSTDDAVEWIDYSVMGIQGNGEGFIMMYEHHLTEDELELLEKH